jgi:hypothetical protein
VEEQQLKADADRAASVVAFPFRQIAEIFEAASASHRAEVYAEHNHEREQRYDDQRSLAADARREGWGF